MNRIKADFVRCMIEQNVLSFGRFTLKSGRQSPYFFNLGDISTGDGLLSVGESYADALLASGLETDVLFGPAYKGIPLVTAMTIALVKKGLNVGASFNRKEAKQHGEGGLFIGAPLEGRRVLLVDDVVTDGTQKRESANMIESAGGKLVGVLVGLDRMEKDSVTGKSSLESLQESLDLPVLSVANLDDVIDYLQQLRTQTERVQELIHYREQYC